MTIASKKPLPRFSVALAGNGNFLLNGNGRTIAIISKFGYVDWLLNSVDQNGPLLSTVQKETHLAHILGYKFLLFTPEPFTGNIETITWEIDTAEGSATLLGTGVSNDKAFKAVTRATISADDFGRYFWSVTTDLTCIASRAVTLNWIEYNNVLPSNTGQGFLCTPNKQFVSTLLTDRDGVIWDFPHQHAMHYQEKIGKLHFAAGTLGGFFEENKECPVFICDQSPLEPDWQICDQYYDLHCGARPLGHLMPGQTLTFISRVLYLDKQKSGELLARARRIAIDAADYQKYNYPRLVLGKNKFMSSVTIDELDDASGFRLDPPKLTWDRSTGKTGCGALKIINTTAMETVWTANPPAAIAAGHQLVIGCLVKTEKVVGKGLFLRIRTRSWDWEPVAQTSWPETIVSTPVQGTSDWVRIELPPLCVAENRPDIEVLIEVVLDGAGIGWITEMDVECRDVETSVFNPVFVPDDVVRTR